MAVIHHRRCTTTPSSSSSSSCQTKNKNDASCRHCQSNDTSKMKRRYKKNAVSVMYAQVLHKLGFSHQTQHDDVVGNVVMLCLVGMIVGCFIIFIESVKYIFFSDGIDPSLASVLSSFFSGGRGGYGKHKFPLYPMKPSSIYTIPQSLSYIGDKSDAYALLRKEYDRMYPLNDTQRSLRAVQDAKLFEFTTMAGAPYDIYNCPDEPPENYPFTWHILDIVTQWKPDDPNPPHINDDDQKVPIFQGLCVFDYNNDYDKAMRYQKLELPFVVQNDPNVARTVERWNTPHFMKGLLGPDVKHRCERSENNHFLYWVPPPGSSNKRNKRKKHRLESEKAARFKHHIEMPEDWKQPTEMMRMTFQDWLIHANVTDDSLIGPDQPHWYFRLIGCGETGPQGQCDVGSSEYLFDELPFFQPTKENELYLAEPQQQKGIHCRFGMKGVIAENHFDGSRNTIVVLGGARRYVLAHPNQCSKLSLLPKGHPSARHSAVDWSDPDLNEYPEFKEAMGNEVVLQAGETLYLPTNWFHYIISLSLNYQCNTRSGISPEYMPPIRECGF